jgi:hypothetical protein
VGYRLAADALVLLHGLFVLFVVTGSLLVLWRRWVLWLHLPAAAWGALVEWFGWICPLTPWEQSLRIRAGQSGYAGGFVEHYLVPLIYPEGLTPELQTRLAILVVLLNALLYAVVCRGVRRAAKRLEE